MGYSVQKCTHIGVVPIYLIQYTSQKESIIILSNMHAVDTTYDAASMHGSHVRFDHCMKWYTAYIVIVLN